MASRDTSFPRKTACFLPFLRMYGHIKRRPWFWAACLGLLLIALNVISGIIDSPLALRDVCAPNTRAAQRAVQTQ